MSTIWAQACHCNRYGMHYEVRKSGRARRLSAKLTTGLLPEIIIIMHMMYVRHLR